MGKFPGVQPSLFASYFRAGAKTVLPEGPLPLSAEELLMFRGCIRSDSVVSWLNCGPEVVGGKSLSRALVASSVQDSSLAALTKLLGSYLEGGAAIDFVLHDTMAVRACLSALHLAFQHSTEALAISYANVIMARRDLFFSLLRCRQRFAPL